MTIESSPVPLGWLPNTHPHRAAAESLTIEAVCAAGPSLTPDHDPTEFSGLADRWIEMPVMAPDAKAGS